MSYANLHGGASAYKKVGTQSEIHSASPHRIIQMLMEGALEKIAMAKGFIDRKETAGAGSHISWAISIIDGLRMSLDKNIQSEITRNLDDLYDYMGRRLLQANQEQNAQYLDEVANLLKEIKSAWDAIPDDAKNAHQEPHRYIK